MKLKVTDAKTTSKSAKTNSKSEEESKIKQSKNSHETDRHKASSQQSHDKTNSLEGSRSGSLDRYKRVKRRRRTDSSQSSDDDGIPMGTVELQGDPRSPKRWGRPSVKDYNVAVETSGGAGIVSQV